MARISLVLCDLCGDKMNDEEVDLYKVNLICEKEDENSYDRLETGEICRTCYHALIDRLKGDKVALQSRRETVEKPPAKNATEAPPEQVESPYGAPDKPIGQNTTDGRTPTKELLDDELQVVPSRFEKRKAERAARKMRGSCPHNFKMWKDGKVVCGPPPDGFNGELDKLDNPNGCGKTLNEAEY